LKGSGHFRSNWKHVKKNVKKVRERGHPGIKIPNFDEDLTGIY
jgi:hypothetical protein